MANEKALTFSKNAKTLADTSHKGAMPCLFPAAALNLKQLQKRKPDDRFPCILYFKNLLILQPKFS